ncbi:hypothetical protein JCM15765_04480 [Paradesulfitobacterium aromaticivorans]
MSIVENIRSLCKQRNTSIPKLEKEFGFGNGAIYNWDKNSPSVDKVQKVADYFGVTTDFIINGFDKEIEDVIKFLAKTDRSRPYFPDNIAEILDIELEPLKKEYWDVPLDLEPLEMVGLLKEFPVTIEFKKDLLDALSRVKERVNSSDNDSRIFTLAAHKIDGYNDNLTPEEQAAVRAFIEAYRKQFAKKEDKPE